jgi:ankyrin repeat protein
MYSIRAPLLPTEILLIIAKYLEPLDQVALLQVSPGITSLFSFHQFASVDENGDNILHHLARGNTAIENSREPSFYITFLHSLLHSTRGAILHSQSLRGETPLMEAAFVGSIAFIKLLLEKDPDGLNVVDGNGATALWYALNGRQAPALALLLE